MERLCFLIACLTEDRLYGTHYSINTKHKMKMKSEYLRIDPNLTMLVIYRNQNTKPRIYCSFQGSRRYTMTSATESLRDQDGRSPNSSSLIIVRWTPWGKRKEGKPKATWRITVEKEIKAMSLRCSHMGRGGNGRSRQNWLDAPCGAKSKKKKSRHK